ncbi:MAG: helix-turn-helix transcriptional regulator [Verrucomicrobia bacterium]|nr:helix-turn-helix transcriptional regulator [Verrucomicrobiota bacterium]
MAFVTQVEFLRSTADKVRSLRLAAGWTQDDFAARARIAPATYRLFERTGRIALDRLYRIAAVLGRVGELSALFQPAPYTSLEELAQPPQRQRGRRRTAGREAP